ncbi:MAG: stage II sporulation protein D [Clostridia bacterium]|nr:stage II sporulation protein D [Clostridia bacterium]
MIKMRTNLVLCIIVALALILCPIAAVGSGAEDNAAESAAVFDSGNEYISVMSPSTGDISRVDMREYITGCVAAEMPALYHSEALKAQAVASYTYAKRTLEQNKNGKNSLYGGADITDSPDTHQGYINEKKRKEKWGSEFEKYESKIRAAVDAVFGLYMEYEGETALAAYHSISAGSTQSALNMWGEDYPYLASVESRGDILSPDYISEAFFSEKEFRKLAKQCGVKLSGDAEEWIGEIKTNGDGYARTVELGGSEITAAEFREAFSLRSPCFDISYSGGEFTVMCKGHGHGVGMSQYGADYMARQGSTWRQILQHYYTGVEFVKEYTDSER